MNDSTPRPAPAPEPIAQEKALEIVEYWRAIAKRRWSILATTLLVAILASIYASSIRPLYRATAEILIEQGKKKVVSIEEVYSQGFIQREYFQSQVEIIKSDELAIKAIEKLKLTTHPDYDPRQAEPGFMSKYLGFLSTDGKPPSEEAVLNSVLANFQGNLQVRLVRSSHLAQITFISHDPQLAAKVPNTMAELFIESDLEARVEMTQKASSWLQERMGELRTKVDTAEKNLQAYRDRERLIDAKGLALSGATKQLEELTRSLVESRAKRAEAEAAYNLVQQVVSGKVKTTYDTIPAVLRHPLVQKMKEAEGEAERRVNEAGQRYGPEHPAMMKAKAELNTARENARRQIESVVTGISREYEVARANEQAVERALAQSKGDIRSLNRKEFELGLLEREVQQNRNLYEMFLSRQKETSNTSDLQSTIARIVDHARVPGGAFAPNRARIVGVSAVMAMLLSIVLVLLLDRFSNTLNSTSDVERRLRVPVLGVLQLIKGISGRKGFASELAFFNDSQSAFSEAVRTIRTSVLMSSLDNPHKVVVVTSSVPEEGKTTVAYNLACALGQVKKVLLIDADMRRPKVAKLIGRDSKAPGLADLVAQQASVNQCIFHHEKARIHVLPAGTIPPNPLELMTSRRFEDMIGMLAESFDIIVIDSAPLQLVSDSLVLAKIASALIYVVKAGATPYQVAQNGLRRLARVNAPILGVVLNQLDIEKAEKYYGEYSGYRSYKGYKKYGYDNAYGRTYGQLPSEQAPAPTPAPARQAAS